MSCLSPSPESAEISMVAQSCACGKNGAVATERLSLSFSGLLALIIFQFVSWGK